MSNSKKEQIKKVTKVKLITNPNTKFYFLVGAGIGFGIAGMSLPPIGVIDWTVLTLIAQLLILAAAVVGLDIKFNLKEGIFDSDCDEKDGKEDNKE